MGIADLHLHSVYSKDGTASIEAILWQAKVRELDIIAITDHNNMRGVSEALTLMNKYDLQVIPGVEISTADGHLLAYEINHPLPPRLPMKDTVLRIHELGGFCMIPHPMSLGADAIRREVIRDALQDPDIAETIIGIEVINGGLLRRNQQAANLPQELNLAPVANSDSHNILSVGRAATEFTGHTILDLKKALRERNTKPVWKHRLWDPVYYLLHTGFRLFRQIGFGMGLDENHQRLSMYPLHELKN